MRIKSREILGRNCFDEITNPKQLFEFNKLGIIGVSHSYYAQWSGRHLNLKKENLSLYNSETLKLIAHIDGLRFPINDVDFNKERQLVLIATGSYDGGFCYEGELFCYDISNHKLIKLIEDNREYSNCKFKSNEIEFKVLPSNDYDEDYTVKTYTTLLELGTLKKLKDLIIKEKVTFKEDSYEIESHQNRLNDVSRKLISYAINIDMNYEHYSMAWDLKFINEDCLFIGYSNGKVGVLDISKNRLVINNIAENGDCVQVFKDCTQEELYVNVSFRKVGTEDYNTIFKLDKTFIKPEKLTQGVFFLSQSENGNFLARQTDYEEKNRKDILFDKSFNKISEYRLGHFDLFNHYIRIDGEQNLFALIGKPKEQHQNKKLIELSASNLKELSGISIENQPEHFNNLNGIRIGEKFIIEGEIYNPNPSVNKHVVFAFNNKGERLWQTDISGQTSGIIKIEEHPDYVGLTLVNGEFVILNCSNGKISLKTERNREINGYPLSITNIGNKIAIGYDNGLIERIEIEKNTKPHWLKKIITT